MGVCSHQKQKEEKSSLDSQKETNQQNQKNASSFKGQSNRTLKIPTSKYSLAFSIPYNIGDTLVLDISDGLAYNMLVKMGVQKQKNQQSTDYMSVFMYKQLNTGLVEKYIQFGFIAVNCNTIQANDILNDAKTSRVLFNFKYIWIFKDEEDVSQKHLAEFLDCLENQKIKTKQVNYYSKSLNEFLQRLNLSQLQFSQFYFPLQMFCTSDILEQTKLREESFNIYVHGSSHLANIIQNNAVNLYLKHLSIKTILFFYDIVDVSLLQSLSNEYRVEVMNFKKPNQQAGQSQVNEQLIQKHFLPLMEKIQGNNYNLLLVHDSSQPQTSQHVREALEFYLQIGLLISIDDIKKYLDERKTGISLQQIVQVNCQIKSSKIKIVNLSESNKIQTKSRCEEMKELYQNLLQREKQEILLDSCHNTILKLLQNIINNPEMIKFKQVYLTNKNIQMNILQYKEGIELMKLSGFTQTSENEQILYNSFEISMIKLVRGDLELAYKKVKEK